MPTSRKLLHIFSFFLFFLQTTHFLQAYDYPDMSDSDSYMRAKVRDYNNQIVAIHILHPMPLPYFGAPMFYGLPGKNTESPEELFINNCVNERNKLSASSKSQNNSIPNSNYFCLIELKEWKSSLVERRSFHRDFCKNPEELAYLDFLAFGNPLLDPYEICKKLREDEMIQKNIESLRVDITQSLIQIAHPPKLFLPTHSKADNKDNLDKQVKSIEEDWAIYASRIGVLDVYFEMYEGHEAPEIHIKSWDTFLAQDKFLNYYQEKLQKLKNFYANLLRAQIRKNSPKYNEKSKKEVLALSRKMLAFSDWELSEKQKLINVSACLNKLSVQNPSMSFGFYLGFYKKYSIKYEVEENFLDSLADPIYKNTFTKIQKLFWRQNQGSALFKSRLDFIHTSCNYSLEKNERDLTLKFLLSSL
ncbi:MAG: hypothetical protein JJT78_01210 [Leptospira sp.]|nr:hypothetical protein [Leptospira sp.]